jgi:hypothetical protein
MKHPHIFMRFLLLLILCSYLTAYGQTPVLIGSCDVPGAENLAFSMKPDYVFICGDSYNISSVDISNPYNPRVVDNLYGSGETMEHIFIRRNSAYITGWTTNLKIVNISDPDNLTLISSWDPGNDIFWLHSSYIIDDIAYISTCDGFLTINVSDESSPILLRRDIGSQDGYGMCVEGNYLYTVDMDRGFCVFDISNIANPSHISTTPLCLCPSWYSSVRNGYVYEPAGDYGLITINANDPISPVMTDSISIQNYTKATYIVNHFLFLASFSGLSIFDISNPAVPRRIAGYPGSYTGVYATEQYIYLAGQDRFKILTYDATSTEDEQELLPKSPNLLSSYPNPFNAQTTISYSLAEPGPVTLTIYNLLGQKVATLYDGVQTAGEHKTVWDAGNQTSGIYFYRISAGRFIKSEKMLLLK